MEKWKEIWAVGEKPLSGFYRGRFVTAHCRKCNRLQALVPIGMKSTCCNEPLKLHKEDA